MKIFACQAKPLWDIGIYISSQTEETRRQVYIIGGALYMVQRDLPLRHGQCTSSLEFDLEA